MTKEETKKELEALLSAGNLLVTQANDIRQSMSALVQRAHTIMIYLNQEDAETTRVDGLTIQEWRQRALLLEETNDALTDMGNQGGDAIANLQSRLESLCEELTEPADICYSIGRGDA